MNNGPVRVYGQPPFRAVFVHGGPGACGSLAGAARELGAHCGVIEPWQTKTTIPGLVAELHAQVAGVTPLPQVFIGHSWGAWLVLLLAAAHPAQVRHVVLAGCGPLEEHYTRQILQRRLARLAPGDARRFTELLAVLEAPDANGKDAALEELGALAHQSDNVAPVGQPAPETQDGKPATGASYATIWPQAAAMRRDGRLLAVARRITVPLTVIHGEDDPHPVEGVTGPLAANGIPFDLHRLPRCGHSPFNETAARGAFLQNLLDIINNGRQP